MTRRLTAGLAVAALLALAAFDLATAELDPYSAPPLFALGSGQGSGGAHCAALPE
jgi:hypothetical protein